MKPTLFRVANEWLTTVCAVVVIALTTLLLCGCQTAAPGSPTATGVQRFLPLVDSAAFTGSMLYLHDYPAERPAFTTAQAALAVLADRDVLTFTELQTAFRPLLERSVRELRDPRTQILISTTVTLVDAYAGQLDASQASVSELRKIAKAASNGIARALILTEPPR